MLNLSEDFREAALPLLDDGLVDALAWSIDLGWGRAIPDWAEALLEAYGEAGRLYAHGVELSLLSWPLRAASAPLARSARGGGRATTLRARHRALRLS